MNTPFRVLALHHNSILREGISVLIETHEGLHLVGSVAAPEAAIVLFEKERPDLTLIDLDLPSDGGLVAIHRIKVIDPEAAIIGLVTYDWDPSVTRAMELGAASVLAKDLIGDLLVPLIRGIHAQKFFLDQVFEGRSTPQN
jgi:DNA-binding NarL/FixJ family response regulator